MSTLNCQTSIPVFSTYKQRENQISHGLTVTLDQFPEFRKAFIKSILAQLSNSHPLTRYPVSKLAEHAQISTQSYFGNAGFDDIDEIVTHKSIPDILIQWDEEYIDNDLYRPCIVIEAKVEATWSQSQAFNHYHFASKAGFNPIGVAITTEEVSPSDLPAHWISFSWGKIYRLAKLLGGQFWAHQLIQLLEVTEEKLMTSPAFTGTLTEFSGLPFADRETPYHPQTARRVMKLLIKALNGKKRDLKKIGVSVSEPKTISSQTDGSIWHEADPLPLFRKLLSDSYKPPHFNFTIGVDYFSCGLTFPNSSFNRIFKQGIHRLTEQDLIEQEMLQLLDRLMTIDSLKIQYTPYMYLHQQHFLSQKSPPTQDALLRADLRTMTGYSNSKRKLNIKQNPQWIELLSRLVLEKPPQCHLQAGFGVRVPYSKENDTFFTSPDAITELLFKTWRALIPFAKAIAARD